MVGILIHGAGGHGKVVADLVRALGFEVAGFVDANESKLDRVVEPGGARVVASEATLLAAIETGGPLPGNAAEVVVAIGDNRARLRLLAAFGKRASRPLVHPSAVVSPSARIAPGSVVFPRAVVNADTTIGDGVIVNTGAVVEHDCVVGSGVHLAPSSTVCGGVTIGPRALVGAGATVIPGVSIGPDASVGAGAVVVRDVRPGQLVVGVPAVPRA